MKWKQFFTPITSIDWPKAKQLTMDLGPEKMVLLDVRQPNEYRSGHLPGSTLIPLGELDGRLKELSPEKSIIIY